MIIEETRGYHKPHTIINSAIKELADYRQWVAWTYSRDGKKLPMNPHTGKQARVNDRTTWATYQQGIACKAGHSFEGVGFMLSEDDPYVGVDLDNCIDAGEVAPWAQEIVEALNSYTEISPSATGLKIWIRGSKPGPRCKAKLASGEVEVYDHNRYFTFTGQVYLEQPIRDAQDELNALYGRLWPTPKKATATPLKQSSCASLEDEKVLDLARTAKNGAKFRRLYDQGDTAGDHSRADLALCQLLAFWTGGDPEQMDQLYRASALMRDKWDERHYADGRTHGEGTIHKAISSNTNTYSPKVEVSKAVTEKVADLRVFAAQHDWTGAGGFVDKRVFEAFLDTVLRHGREDDGGILVTVAYRDIALLARSGNGATIRAIRDLEDKHGLIKKITPATKTTGTTYLVRNPLRKADHISTCVQLWSGLRSLRNSGPIETKGYAQDGSRTVAHVVSNPYLIQSVGQGAGMILDHIHRAGQGITLHTLAQQVSRRPNDLERRQLLRLLVAGLIQARHPTKDMIFDGDDLLYTSDGRAKDRYIFFDGEEFIVAADLIFFAPEDVEERLEEHLKASGCYAQEKLHQERVQREREAHQLHIQPDPAPTEEDMQTIREADGLINELAIYHEEFDVFVPQDEPQQPIPEQQQQIDNVIAIKEPEHSLSCDCLDCSISEPKYASPQDGSRYQKAKPQVKIAA